MGIDPNFNLWNHFFRVRCPQGLGVEMMISGGTIIHGKSRHGMVLTLISISPCPDLRMGGGKSGST
jgi:hypothetical protein